MSTDTQARQRQDRDELALATLFAVELFLTDHHNDLKHVTDAARTELIVQAALGYLIGEGFITVKPRDEWPPFTTMTIPAHLQPDVARAVAELARINAAMTHLTPAAPDA